MSPESRQRDIELILIRQLASYLETPVFIVDAVGTMVFYNEPAEAVLGRRFEETGEMPPTEWATEWEPTDEKGHPVDPESIPLSVALTKGRPAYASFWIFGSDKHRRKIETVAFPLLGQGGRHIGAVAIFCPQRDD